MGFISASGFVHGAYQSSMRKISRGLRAPSLVIHVMFSGSRYLSPVSSILAEYGNSSAFTCRTVGRSDIMFTIFAPLTSSAVRIWPEPLGHPMHAMHEEHGQHQEARAEWVYYSGSEHTVNGMSAAAAGKGAKKATRVFTNDDVERQNQKNGDVKMKGKSEKL